MGRGRLVVRMECVGRWEGARGCLIGSGLDWVGSWVDRGLVSGVIDYAKRSSQRLPILEYLSMIPR
jgi:hypothetical protein